MSIVHCGFLSELLKGFTLSIEYLTESIIVKIKNVLDYFEKIMENSALIINIAGAVKRVNPFILVSTNEKKYKWKKKPYS